MIRVIIKGELHEAHAAAQARGLQLTHEVVNRGTNRCEIIGDVKGELATLAAWFCEQNGPAPYPAGTLLWYRHPSLVS